MEISPKTIAFILFAIWLHAILSQRFSDKDFQEYVTNWINATMGANTTHSFVYMVKKQSQATALLVSGCFTIHPSNKIFIFMFFYFQRNNYFYKVFVREPKLVVYGSLFAILAASTKHFFNLPWPGFYFNENVTTDLPIH